MLFNFVVVFVFFSPSKLKCKSLHLMKHPNRFNLVIDWIELSVFRSEISIEMLINYVFVTQSIVPSVHHLICQIVNFITHLISFVFFFLCKTLSIHSLPPLPPKKICFDSFLCFSFHLLSITAHSSWRNEHWTVILLTEAYGSHLFYSVN